MLFGGGFFSQWVGIVYGAGAVSRSVAYVATLQFRPLSPTTC